MVNVLTLSLLYWKQTTQKSKVDFAQESKIWTASLDNQGTFRTRTLDRYLKLKTLPKNGVSCANSIVVTLIAFNVLVGEMLFVLST